MTKADRKASVTVRIGGEDHAIRSSADPDHTRRCAELVEERVREVKEQSGLVENHRIVILAALSMADRYLQAKEDLEALQRGLESRADRLSERVEAELDASAAVAPNRDPPPDPPS